MVHLTPIQAKLMDILKDGCRHSADDLIRSIDQYWNRENLRCHISHLRQILSTMGQDIVCRKEGGRSGVAYYYLTRAVTVK